jgi:hypothetical protein
MRRDLDCRTLTILRLEVVHGCVAEGLNSGTPQGANDMESLARSTYAFQSFGGVPASQVSRRSGRVSAGDAARQKQVETYRLLFEKMLRNMKKLAEGGTLTPEDKQAPVEF